MLNQKGSITTMLIMIFFPVLFTLMLLLVNVITMVDTKIMLQGAVDRGVYAGASSLAGTMNEVARINRSFRDEYLAKKKEFDSKSEDSAEYIEKRIAELRQNQSSLYDNMNDLLDAGYARAHEISESVIRSNIIKMPLMANWRYLNLYKGPEEKLFEMTDDVGVNNTYLNRELFLPVEIEGISYDPNKYKLHRYEVQKYLIKDSVNYVAIAGGVKGRFVPPLLPRFFSKDGAVEFRVAAAAQPYGGSIKEYALSGEQDVLYHPIFVPLEIVRGFKNGP